MKSLFSVTNILLCLIVLITHLFHLISIWEDIPNTIGILYSDDKPSQFGPKELLFIIPALSIILWIIIIYLKSIRKKFNYVNLTTENKESQYSAMYIMLTLIQTLSFIGCIWLNESFLRDAIGIDVNFYFTMSIISFSLCVFLPILLFIWSITLKK